MIRGAISESLFLGLEASERKIALELVKRLHGKWNRNQLRRRYYDGHNALKDLGIAIPPPLKTVEVVVGWPAKAVDSMIDRTTLQGFIGSVLYIAGLILTDLSYTLVDPRVRLQ